MKEEVILLASWIMCPDGTMLPSFHVHDFREHVTVDTFELNEESKTYEPDETRYSMIDGGTDYLRRGGKFTEMSVYSNDPYEVIRRFVCRGGRGKNSDEHITWTPLFRMSNSWLEAVIEYNEDRGIESIYTPYYKKELDYRKEKQIVIEDQ